MTHYPISPEHEGKVTEVFRVRAFDVRNSAGYALKVIENVYRASGYEDVRKFRQEKAGTSVPTELNNPLFEAAQSPVSDLEQQARKAIDSAFGSEA